MPRVAATSFLSACAITLIAACGGNDETSAGTAAEVPYFQTRLRRQRMARGHDAVFGERDRAALVGHLSAAVVSGGNSGR